MPNSHNQLVGELFDKSVNSTKNGAKPLTREPIKSAAGFNASSIYAPPLPVPMPAAVFVTGVFFKDSMSALLRAFKLSILFCSKRRALSLLIGFLSVILF